jgi:hypothetical protein
VLAGVPARLVRGYDPAQGWHAPDLPVAVDVPVSAS